MNNYYHKKLHDTISKINEIPEDSDSYCEWIKGEEHLKFLRGNTSSNEMVVFVLGKYWFIHSLVVSNDRLSPVDREDLMQWNIDAFAPIANYATEDMSKKIWIERGKSGTGAKTLDDSMQLIFGRIFEGWTGPGRTYYELHQEYTHLTGIHWRPEERAYCRFDEHDDLEPIVTITSREDKNSNIDLISFKWEPLEEYLVASNASLVRVFDFTLTRPSKFPGWSGEPQVFTKSPDFFYRQLVVSNLASYTRGVQIIRPRRSPQSVFTDIKDRWFGKKNKQYVEFTAYDWRNKCETTISTAPEATTNYFDTEGNMLPFELSPAFFNPEVLLKYKADRDKYTVGERHVSSRTAWHLEAIDVNDAGQIHAYIRYLRRLPHKEQLYWSSFNERPKAGLSRRAIINDFQGEFEYVEQPIQKVLAIVYRWHNDKVAWWTLRNEELLERVNVPLTKSRDEWGEAFMDLDKLVIEGFVTKTIRKILEASAVQFDEKDQSITLLKKFLSKKGAPIEVQNLEGLRTVKALRSKVKGHSSGTEARQLAEDAYKEYGSYANHFQHFCAQVADELETIEKYIV